MTYFRLAWRNIWRNRRRSLIIITSVVVGLTAVVFLEGVMRGFMQQALDNQLGAHTAHLQIHRAGYMANPDIGNFIAQADRIDEVIAQEQRIVHSSRRILTQGLLSSARNSSGMMLVGIEPNREKNVTTIMSSIISGRALGTDPREILISERIAKTLDVKIGEKLVAMSSTRNGRVGSELYRIVGFYRTAISEFDRYHAYVNYNSAQSLIGVGSDAAEFAMITSSTEALNQIRDSLRTVLGPEYEVLSYFDTVPFLAMQLEMTQRMMIVYYLIVGIAMIFGIINTMMMSVYERIREFGVLKAVGMRDQLLLQMVLTEAALIGTIGTIIGIIFGSALTLYTGSVGLDFSWFAEGLASWGSGAVIWPMLDPLGSLERGILIIILCVIAAIHPAL
ncbi:MAG: ABC transporter permease, partial [Bacteroidetes bacterium]|nr:ABC transporter permease [Bacteroidota bacterium]